MKNVFFISILTTCLACSSPKIIPTAFQGTYGELEILSLENNQKFEDILFIPDDDTITIEEQINWLNQIYNGKKNIYAFPKMSYKNLLRKNNTDRPEIRLENLVVAYNYLQSNQSLDSSKNISVWAIGEGTIVAPHFARLVQNKSLTLVNPYVYSMGENFSLILAENDAHSVELAKHFHFTETQDWLDFFDHARLNDLPDKYVGTKPLSYYSAYWQIKPQEYLVNNKEPIYLIVFSDYLYTSLQNKEMAMQMLNGRNYIGKNLSGNWFTQFSIQEIKKLNIN